MRIERIATGLALVLLAVLLAQSPAQGDESASDRPHAACWNEYFPFEPERPDFLVKPKRCLLYRDHAKTYSEGAVLGTSLRWRIFSSRAVAEGKLDEPKNDRLRARHGRLVLSNPVESCGGREVYSRLEYSIKTGRQSVHRAYRVYTC